MEWTRSNTIGMAKTGCVHCGGLGMRITRGFTSADTPCNCVMRKIFRAVYSRFKNCASSQGHAGTVNMEHCGSGKDSRRSYGRKTEDFMADFCLVSERSLNAADYKLFRYHYLLGADWKMCCKVLKTDRGNFFHACYRIEAKLGRVFATLQPYGLYPLDEYFGNVIRKDAPFTPPSAPAPAKHIVRPPVLPFPVQPEPLEGPQFIESADADLQQAA